VPNTKPPLLILQIEYKLKNINYNSPSYYRFALLYILCFRVGGDPIPMMGK
jgi:hypothetical protein